MHIKYYLIITMFFSSASFAANSNCGNLNGKWMNEGGETYIFEQTDCNLLVTYNTRRPQQKFSVIIDGKFHEAQLTATLLTFAKAEWSNEELSLDTYTVSPSFPFSATQDHFYRSITKLSSVDQLEVNQWPVYSSGKGGATTTLRWKRVQ